MLQLRVRHTEVTATEANPAATLDALAAELEASPSPWARVSQVVESGLTDAEVRARRLVEATGTTEATWGAWRASLRRAGLGVPDWPDLRAHHDALRRIFDAITTDDGDRRVFNDLDRRSDIEVTVRRAFHPARTLTTETETVPESARLLGVGGVPPIASHGLLYPSEGDVAEILRRDAAGIAGGGLSPEDEETVRALERMGRSEMADEFAARGRRSQSA